MRTVFILLAGLLYLPPAAATDSQTSWLEAHSDPSALFSTEGYRLTRYRSPTPEHSEHGATLTTEQLRRLLDTRPKPALLNVQGLTWQNGFFIQDAPKQQLPGSRWLPNVGKGELDGDWETYYRYHLQQVSGGRQDYPIVIYCRADCWMSWNAVKRAAGWGYSNLYWYRDGTDGWREAELELTVATPQAFPIEENGTQQHSPPQGRPAQ